MQIRMRRASRSVAVAAAAALASCATVEPIVTKPQEANVAVVAPCATDIPEPPALLAADEWAKPVDEFARVQALKIDRTRLIAANGTLRAKLVACATGATPKE